MNMKVDIQYKDNTTFKLTITSNNEVRIKVQDGCNEKIENVVIDNFLRFADIVMRRGWNNVTLRGKVKAGDDRLSLYTDKKDFVCNFIMVYSDTKLSLFKHLFNYDEVFTQYQKNEEVNDNSILEKQIENETGRLFYLNREKQMAEEKAIELGNIDPTEALYQRCRANAITKISKKDS